MNNSDNIDKSTNDISYGPYPNQPSLEQLIEVMRFNNNSRLKDNACQKVIDTYVYTGSYIDLQKMADDEWLDNKYRNFAKESILESALKNYESNSSSLRSENPKNIPFLDYVKNLLFNKNVELYSFVDVATSPINIHDKISFSENVFNSWVDKGSYSNLSSVIKNKIGYPGDKSPLPEEIISLARAKVDDAAKVHFAKIKSLTVNDSHLDFMKYPNLYDLLMNTHYISKDLIISETLDVFNSLNNKQLFHSFNESYGLLIKSDNCPEDVKNYIKNSRETVPRNFYYDALKTSDYISIGLLKKGSSFIPEEVVSDAENVFDLVVSRAMDLYLQTSNYSSLKDMASSPSLSRSQRRKANKFAKKIFN